MKHRHRIRQKLKRIPPIYRGYLWYRHNLHSRFFPKSPESLYSQWIKSIEPSLWQPCLERPQQVIRISVVVPVFNPPAGFLKDCIGSVQEQTFSNWELLLVDDASTRAEVKAILRSAAARDERIKLIELEVNSHISKATNVGIEAAGGDYVALLDHDDCLSPHALNEVAATLLVNPHVKWIYSDEDLMSESGERLAPHFKSDWNPFLLRSHNYITHLCVYQRTFMLSLGGCRKGLEGAQDYDLALRASINLAPHEIYHIPKVLYHWRIHNTSAASGSEAKPYTVEAGRKALIDYFDEIGLETLVEPSDLDNFYNVSYRIDVWPKVTIIIPTRDQHELLEACINSVLENTDYPDLELVIVDNQSRCPETLSYLNSIAKRPNIRVLPFDEPFNYSRLNNLAVEQAQTEIICLLNNDTEVITPDWLRQMVGIAMQQGVGCVGAKLRYPDDTLQHAGVILGLGGYAAHSHRCMSIGHAGYFNRPHVNQVLSALTGACLVIRKDLFLEAGGLDEAFLVAYSDVDFCLRVGQAGYLNVYCASAELYHHESKSRGNDHACSEKTKRFDAEKALLLERWKSVIENDPYYSPHLTRSAENFSIRLEY